MDAIKERFTVTLKQSLVGASDAAYLQSLFHDLEFAEKLRCVKCPIQSLLHLDAGSLTPLMCIHTIMWVMFKALCCKQLSVAVP